MHFSSAALSENTYRRERTFDRRLVPAYDLRSWPSNASRHRPALYSIDSYKEFCRCCTLQAKNRPVIVLTSNGTRELSVALRRRCLYLWIDYPDPKKELAILNLRLPGIVATRVAEAVQLSQRLRGERLSKPPGVAETIDFAAALDTLDDGALVPETARAALGTLIKDAQDLAQLTDQRLEEILAPRADLEGENPTK